MRYLFLLLCVTIFVACAAAPNVVEPTAVPAPTEQPAPTPTDTPAVPVVETVENVLYATAVDPEAEDQYLDITYLSGSSEQKPVVILAYGGMQLNTSDKARTRFAARELAENGFVVMAIDYNPEVIPMNGVVAKAFKNDGSIDVPITLFREVVEDGACALRFAAEIDEQYGGDPQRVIWAGIITGGWLGTMVSLGEGDIQSHLDDYAAANHGPNQRVDCIASADQASVIGLVSSSSRYIGDFWLDNDAFSWWTPVFAPLREYAAIGNNPNLKVRLIHGKHDTEPITAFANAEAFASALEAAGYDAMILPQRDVGGAYEEQVIEQILAMAGE